MFDQGDPTHEFYCERFLGIMRVYASVGFMFLGILPAALVAAVWWVRSLR